MIRYVGGDYGRGGHRGGAGREYGGPSSLDVNDAAARAQAAAAQLMGGRGGARPARFPSQGYPRGGAPRGPYGRPRGAHAPAIQGTAGMPPRGVPGGLPRGMGAGRGFGPHGAVGVAGASGTGAGAGLKPPHAGWQGVGGAAAAGAVGAAAAVAAAGGMQIGGNVRPQSVQNGGYVQADGLLAGAGAGGGTGSILGTPVPAPLPPRVSARPRRVPQRLFTAEEIKRSPSNLDGVGAFRELTMVYATAALVRRVCERVYGLKTFRPTTTALVFFHRFFQRQSLKKHDRRHVALACVFLAGKVEECPMRVDKVVLAALQVMEGKERLEDLKSADISAKRKALRKVVTRYERIVLHTVEFDLCVEHGHKHVVKQVKYLEGNKQLAGIAYALLTDVYSTRLCLLYAPSVLSMASVYLAAHFVGCIPSGAGASRGRQEWPTSGRKWRDLMADHKAEIEDIISALMDFYRYRSDTSSPFGFSSVPRTSLHGYTAQVGSNAPPAPAAAGLQSSGWGQQRTQPEGAAAAAPEASSAAATSVAQSTAAESAQQVGAGDTAGAAVVAPVEKRARDGGEAATASESPRAKQARTSGS